MPTVPLALDDFRRGGIVLLHDPAAVSYLVLAAELATAASVDFVRKAGTAGFKLATTAGDLILQIANPNLPACEIVFANEQGLLQSEGIIGAAVDVARMSGLKPTVLLSALPLQDSMPFARRHCLPILSIDDVTRHRHRNESALDLVAVADLPISHSDRPFRAHSFRCRFDGVEHLALVSPGTAVAEPLVRIHSECLTGDAFGSLRCDCGPQLSESLRRLAASPGGILVYMRGHEGRGIGLANKMRAYALQDQGMDTVEANRALGLPDDARDFAHAAQILRALGHFQVRLLTNNPEKADSLRRHRITVTKVEPLIIPPNPFNARYLSTKAEKLGHALHSPFPNGELSRTSYS